MIPFNLEEILANGGALIALMALFAIIFAESGLFFGFFLPGDSLLLTAGVISAAHQEAFPIWAICVVCFVAAISGDAVGYSFGHRYGRRLYQKPESRFFKQEHLRAAEAFYEKHGGKTIVIARFMPFVRTFAPIVAGAASMSYRRFAVFNFTGAALWAIGLPIAGYALGRIIPPEILDRWLLVILAVVVALSLLPTFIHIYRSNREEVHARIRSRGRRGAMGPKADEPGA